MEERLGKMKIKIKIKKVIGQTHYVKIMTYYSNFFHKKYDISVWTY